MIPKKIHFTWFSKDPFPSLVKQCMETWKEKLPDYEFIHWDMDKISKIDNIFLKQALQVKKWAFAADFVRLYALYTEGGIYLDTDVEVYRNFDDLLQLKAFIGKENSYHVQRRRAFRYLTSHCMGAEAGHPYIKSCLDYYNDRPFTLSKETWLPDSLKYDQTILPFIQTEIAKIHGYHPSDKVKGEQQLNDGVTIFPYEYFDCLYQTKDSYCRHHAMGGWRTDHSSRQYDRKEKLRRKLYVALERGAGFFGMVFFRRL